MHPQGQCHRKYPGVTAPRGHQSLRGYVRLLPFFFSVFLCLAFKPASERETQHESAASLGRSTPPSKAVSHSELPVTPRRRLVAKERARRRPHRALRLAVSGSTPPGKPYKLVQPQSVLVELYWTHSQFLTFRSFSELPVISISCLQPKRVHTVRRRSALSSLESRQHWHLRFGSTERRES